MRNNTVGGRALNVGIVGCGRIAEHHLKFLVKRNDISAIAIADQNIEQARKTGEKYFIDKCYPSIEELLEKEDLDVLHILTPPQYHYEQALKGIEKEIHLLIEKPLTLSYEHTDKLYSLASEKKLKICPDFIHLFNPILIEAKKLIQKKELGELITAECHLAIAFAEKDSQLRESVGLHWSYKLPGGIMQNNITHPLYLVLDWIGKSRNIIVSPRHLGTFSQEITDYMDIILEGEKANGTISITIAQKYPSYFLKLYFSKGILNIDLLTQTLTVGKVNRLPRSINRMLMNYQLSQQLINKSTRNIVHYVTKKIVPYHGLKNLIDAYYNWIKGDSAPPITRELSLEVSRVENNIIKQAGKVHLENDPRSSTQVNISKKEKILVTGSTGYLGSEVIHSLINEGYYVRAYVRESSYTKELEESGVEIVYGDIRQKDKLIKAVRGADIVIHLAAALKGSKSFMLDCGVNGARNIADAARKEKIKRVIYISSFSVYDYYNVKDGDILKENSQLERHAEKRGAYSLAKRKTEDIALANLTADGPAWTILRPSRIFGNGNGLLSIVGFKVGNTVISLRRRKNHLRLIHINDVARAIITCIENESTQNRIFNISHEDQVTIDELVRECFKNNGSKNYHFIYVPYSVSKIGTIILQMIREITGKGPTMNIFRLTYLCRDLLADSKAFHSATDWLPNDPLIAQLKSEVDQFGIG